MADVTIKISAETKDLELGTKKVIKEFQDLKKATEEVTKSTNTTNLAFASFIGNLTSSLTLKGIDFLKNELVDFFKSSIQESIKANKAINDFNTALALSGRYTQKASEDFQQFAENLSAVTIHEDDVILKNAALLQSITKLNDKGLKDALIASTDLAALKQIDLASAVDLVSKAALGNTSVLSRYGIYVSQAGSDAEKFQEALREISKQAGGASQAQLKSYEGIITKIGHSFSDLKKTVGELITQNPLFIKSLKGILDFTKGVVENLKLTFTAMNILFSLKTKGQTIEKDDSQKFFEDLSAKNVGVKATTKGTVKTQTEIDSEIKKERQLTKDFFQTGLQVENVIGQGLKTPFGALGRDIDFERLSVQQLSREQKNELAQMESRLERNKLIGTGAGVLSGVLGGAGGAKGILGGLVGLGGNAILPGLGQAIGPLAEQLMAGPEQTRAMVKAFAEATPELIENLIDAIPVLIEELNNQFPIIIDRLAERAPMIINKLVEQAPSIALATATSLQTEMPKVAATFIESLIKNAPSLIGAMAEGIKNAIEKIVGNIGGVFGGGSGGGGIGGVLKKLKFAEGGQGFVKTVPAGFSNDTFPARLTSGELVVDRSTAIDLKNFLSASKNQSSMANSILLKILDAVSNPITVESEVSLNRKVFADILLELNRTNSRVS